MPAVNAPDGELDLHQICRNLNHRRTLIGCLAGHLVGLQPRYAPAGTFGRVGCRGKAGAEAENIVLIKNIVAMGALDEARAQMPRAVIGQVDTVDRASVLGLSQTCATDGLGRHAYPNIVDYVEVFARAEVSKIRPILGRRTGPWA